MKGKKNFRELLVHFSHQQLINPHSRGKVWQFDGALYSDGVLKITRIYGDVNDLKGLRGAINRLAETDPRLKGFKGVEPVEIEKG